MMRAATIFLCLAGSVLVQDTSGPVFKTRIPLTNVDGRMDHLSVDVKGQRLFASALGNNTVEVIDVRAGQRVRTLPGLAEPQGLLYDASNNRLYAASGVDEDTGQPLAFRRGKAHAQRAGFMKGAPARHAVPGMHVEAHRAAGRQGMGHAGVQLLGPVPGQRVDHRRLALGRSVPRGDWRRHRRPRALHRR